MRPALETITAVANSPGAGTPGIPVNLDSLTLRDAKAVRMLDFWSRRDDGGGSVRYTSPLLHDAQVGMQWYTPSNLSQVQVHAIVVPQDLVPQDTLTVTIFGGPTEDAVDCYTVLYEDLGGIDARFIGAEGVKKRLESLYNPFIACPVVDFTAYGNAVPITQLDDQLKANREYAILGMTYGQDSSLAACVRITAPDWGNLKVAVPSSAFGPGAPNMYFYDLARRFGIECIPVFNASNKDTIFFDSIGTGLGGNVNITVTCALLKPKGR